MFFFLLLVCCLGIADDIRGFDDDLGLIGPTEVAGEDRGARETIFVPTCCVGADDGEATRKDKGAAHTEAHREKGGVLVAQVDRRAGQGDLTVLAEQRIQEAVARLCEKSMTDHPVHVRLLEGAHHHRALVLWAGQDNAADRHVEGATRRRHRAHHIDDCHVPNLGTKPGEGSIMTAKELITSGAGAVYRSDSARHELAHVHDADHDVINRHGRRLVEPVL